MPRRSPSTKTTRQPLYPMPKNYPFQNTRPDLPGNNVAHVRHRNAPGACGRLPLGNLDGTSQPGQHATCCIGSVNSSRLSLASSGPRSAKRSVAARSARQRPAKQGPARPGDAGLCSYRSGRKFSISARTRVTNVGDVRKDWLLRFYRTPGNHNLLIMYMVANRGKHRGSLWENHGMTSAIKIPIRRCHYRSHRPNHPAAVNPLREKQNN